MSQTIEAAPAQIQTPQSSFTRPANTTAYASGNLVANSTTAALVVPLAFDVSPCNARGKVRRARIAKSGTTVTNAQFRLHLYSVTPATIANGDGGAWSTSTSGYLGSLSLGAAMARAFTDGAEDIATPDAGVEINFNAPNNDPTFLYGLLEARAAYTPVSAEVFTVTLEIAQI